MRQKIVDFIKSQGKTDEKSIVNYKPVEYRNIIECLPFWEVVSMIEKDFSDLKSYIPEEKQDDARLLDCLFETYKKHIVAL